MIDSKSDKDYPPIKLNRPEGQILARWVGSSQPFSGFVHIRYWNMDTTTKRFKPVLVIAQYCRIHKSCFVKSDFPSGCPECQRAKPN